VEHPIRLAGSAFCYRPPDDAPPVTERPVDPGAPITYGSFNTLAKLSDPTIRAWGRILAEVPHARLHLKAKGLADADVRRGIADRLAAVGVATDRLLLQSWEPRSGSHLAAYGGVDIALDAFPYNGATTTCEALWMGVPVVTWSGATHASRMGSSILHAAGFPEWVTDSEPAYVERATDLARDRESLALVRRRMRQRLRASALLAIEPFARAFEQACVQMWQCGTEPMHACGET